MAPKLFFHLHAEPSAFYLAYSSEIVHVEESWEGNKRMQGPEAVLEFEQHALVYALHPSKDLLFSLHEDGSLRCTHCISSSSSTSWTSKILTQVPQLMNKEIYGLYLMKASECVNKDALIESPTGSLLIFIGSNEADYICYNCIEDKLLLSPPIRLPNHFKHPYLEYYSAPKPASLIDLLRHHQKDFTSNSYMSLGDIKDIQLFPKAFYILDTFGNLSQYCKDLRVNRIQTEVVGFCLRRAYGSCIQKNGTVLTWKLPFKSNPEDEEDVEHLSRPALLRKTLKASQDLGKVNKLISENSAILTQYGLLPMLDKSKIQTNFSITKDNVIKLKLINLLEMDLNGDFWFLKVRISPYNSSEQFYQVFRLPPRLPKLESWFVYLNLPEAIKTPKYLPLGLQLFFVFTAPQKIRIQSRPLTQTQLTAFDFLQVVQESETPIQKTRMTHTSTQESLRDYLGGLNARRRVAKSLLRESSISLSSLTEKLTFNFPKSIIESQSTISHLSEYSELKVFEHEYSCLLQMKKLEEGIVQLTFKNTNEILFAALKRGIVSLRQEYAEEGNSTRISRDILQNLRTARKKVEALYDSNDIDKYRETYVFVRTKVSNTLL